MLKYISLIAAMFISQSTSVLAVNMPSEGADNLVKQITDAPLSDREFLLAGAFAMIIVIGLLAFRFGQKFSHRTLLALIMISVFISTIALIFLFGTAYGQSPVFGLLATIAMLCLFKLMNQFEINK